MKKIASIWFNWYFTPAGDAFSYHVVGQNGVTKIEVVMDLSAPSAYVVDFEDGRQEYIVNVNRVFLGPEEVERSSPKLPWEF